MGAHFVTRAVTRDGALDGPLYQADLHDTVVEAAEEEEGRHQEGADVDDVQPPLLCHVVQGSHWKTELEQVWSMIFSPVMPMPMPRTISPKMRKMIDLFLKMSNMFDWQGKKLTWSWQTLVPHWTLFCSEDTWNNNLNARSLPRTSLAKNNIPGKGIVEGVEKEGVVAMRTSDPAHPRHLKTRYLLGQKKYGDVSRRDLEEDTIHLRNRNRCGWRGSQVDDPLTVWSAHRERLMLLPSVCIRCKMLWIYIFGLQREMPRTPSLLHLGWSGISLYKYYCQTLILKNTGEKRPGASDPLGAAFAD